MAIRKLYCIHGADVQQHLGKIEQISKRLKEQRRIADFISLGVENAANMLPGKFAKKDLLVLLLSDDLETKRRELTTLLSQIKEKFPESTIVEIIIDHIPFANEYITLPTDLKPIRNAPNPNVAWENVEEELKGFLASNGIDWRNVLKFAAPVVIALVALLIWLWPPDSPKKKEEQKESAEPIASVGVEAEFNSSVTECKVPCEVKFTNASSAGSSFKWEFGDGDESTEESPTHVFKKAGSYDVKLVASKDGEQSVKTVAISVSDMLKPKAAFSSDKTSCNAPCTIAFTNSSENADKYRWDFDNGQFSEEVSPQHTFNSKGTFSVKLTALGNNQEDVFTHDIIIDIPPPPVAPIAGFSPSKTNCTAPCSIIFTNQSQNATSYRWDFGDNGTSTETNPSHQYTALGKYQVQLVAINNTGQVADAKTIIVGASVNAGPFPIRTTGSEARIETGDDEIDSDDWTSVELSYSVRIVNSRRAIELTLNWYSQERNDNKSKGNTRYKSSKTFPLFTAPSGSVIDDVQGIELSSNNEKYYKGEVHGYQDFPTTGSLEGIKVRVDGPGGSDKQLQALTATLRGFTVLLRPSN